MSSQRQYIDFSNWVHFVQSIQKERHSSFELDIEPIQEFDASKMQEEDELTITDTVDYIPFSGINAFGKQPKPSHSHQRYHKEDSTANEILKCLKQQKQKEQDKFTLNPNQIKQPQSIFLQCQSQGCLKVFTSLYSYQTHYKNKHSQ